MPNWKKVITSGSDASLNSLDVALDITGSNALITNDLDVLGNVGIGTTSPSYPLHISKNTVGNGFSINIFSTATKPDAQGGSVYGGFFSGTGNSTATVDNIVGSRNYGEHKGTGQATFIAGSSHFAVHNGSGNSTGIYAISPKAEIKGTGVGSHQYVLGANITNVLNNSNATVQYLEGAHIAVKLQNGTVTDNAIGLVLDFDYTAGVVSGDLDYLRIQNDTLPTVGGTARAINSLSTLPSVFAGDIGIGTTSPGAKLDVDGDVKFSSYGSGTNTGTATQRLGVTSTGDVIEIPIGSGAVDGSGTTNFVTKWIDGDTVGDSVIFDNGTNVGIGTTSPSEKLEVSGSRSKFNGILVGENSTDIQFQNDGNLTVGNNNWLTLKEGGQEVMRAGGSSGNVGIGTTSPDYPLHVDDTIKIGDRQGTDGSLILQSQQGPNITFKSTGDVLDISGTTGATNGNSIRLSDNIKKLYFNAGIGGTIAINRGNRGLMDSNLGGLEVQQQDTASSNGKSTFLSTSSSGTILRSTSYGSTGTSGDIQFQFGGGANTSEPSPTTKMVIKNSGNVGIGTTSPESLLHLVTSAGDTIQTLESTAGGTDAFTRYVRGASNGWAVGRYNDSSFRIAYASTDAPAVGTGDIFTILNSGNVGIGTTSPSAPLNIVNSNPKIVLEDSDNANTFGQIRQQAGTLQFLSNNNTSNGTIQFKLDNGTATTDAMYIASSGNVGIGTTNPGYKLDVDGSTNSTSLHVNTVNQHVDSRYSAPNNQVAFSRTSTSDQWFKIITAGGTPVTHRVSIISGGDNTNMRDEYLINTAGYSFNTHIQRLPGTRYNTSKLVAIAVVKASNTVVDIWIKLLGMSSGSGTTAIYSNTPIKTNTEILASATTTAPTLANSDTQLDITGTNRSDTTLMTSRGATFGGNVGIGTTNPTEKLEVNGNIEINRTSGTARLTIGTSDSFGRDFYLENSGGAQEIVAENMLTIKTLNNDTQIVLEGGSATDNVQFITNGSERMRITDTGVGIGTTSPSYKFDVETLSTGNQTIASFKTNESTYNGLLIAANNNAGWIGNGTITADEGILFQDTASATRFYTNSAERMRITSTGNVGIGTTSPTAKLDIEGDLQVKGVNISNQENLDVDTGTETIATVAIADYDAAFFDYVIKNGTDLRAGTVFAVHNGTSVEFTETSTSDLGNTSRVTLSVDISGADMRLRATATSDDWIVKSLVRAI